MTRMLLFAPFLLAGCSAAVATDPVRSVKAETRLGQLLAGKVAGRTQSCIRRLDAERQTVIDGRTIIYYGNRSRLYRTEIANCPALDDRSTLIRQSISTNICSGEIFEVRDSGTGFSHGACSYGEFTEYRAAGSR